MGNSFFKFKEFTVYQDKCAMKVSTDACIQGAWTPVSADTEHILDIGAGTGLLSLMLAQRCPNADIDAIEYDKEASTQAQENIDNCNWTNRINVINSDADEYVTTTKYDLVISNPPFYNNSLLGTEIGRNIARHTITLTYEQLFSIIKSNITDNGVASILLPMDSFDKWKSIITKGSWSICNLLYVYPHESKMPNRVVVICSPNKCSMPLAEEHLFIRTLSGEYTAAYKKLMLPYYL